MGHKMTRRVTSWVTRITMQQKVSHLSKLWSTLLNPVKPVLSESK